MYPCVCFVEQVQSQEFRLLNVKWEMADATVKSTYYMVGVCTKRQTLVSILATWFATFLFTIQFYLNRYTCFYRLFLQLQCPYFCKPKVLYRFCYFIAIYMIDCTMYKMYIDLAYFQQDAFNDTALKC